MNTKIIALLEENNKLLKEISAKLSNTSSSSLPMNEILKALGEQYQENPEIVITETTQAYVTNDNLFIVSPKGQMNINLSEMNDKSSFIKKIFVKDGVLFVNFKSNKTYKYTTSNKKMFNEVVNELMNVSRISKPFITLVRNNPEFNYSQV